MVWLTGVPASGKTTLANALADRIRARGRPVEVIDGDVIRTTLCRDLGFSREDRAENVRRVGLLSEMLARNGVTAIVALVSPYREDRDAVRAQVANFLEVHVDCAPDVPRQRDPKGLYARARRDDLIALTGLSAPYEEPIAPDLHLYTDREDVASCTNRLVALLETRDLLSTSVKQ